MTEISVRALSIDSYLEIDDDATAEIISRLVDFIDVKEGEPTPTEFYDEVLSHQRVSTFDGKHRLYIVLQALFGGDMTEKALEYWSPTVEQFVITAEMSTSDVLWAFSAHLQMHPNTTKSFAVILKQLLKKEWVDREEFIDYFSDSGPVLQPGFEKARAVVAAVLQSFP